MFLGFMFLIWISALFLQARSKPKNRQRINEKHFLKHMEWPVLPVKNLMIQLKTLKTRKRCLRDFLPC
jgi:hypothetical protein